MEGNKGRESQREELRERNPVVLLPKENREAEREIARE